MTDQPADADTISALNTILEDEFVSPLTAMRGVLEILRDVEDLEPERRRRFVETALAECTRLEQGVAHLTASVYGNESADEPEVAGDAEFTDRIVVHEAEGIVELDFSGFAFTSSDLVNRFFNAIERRLRAAGRRYYVLVNHLNCTVWPEAWVAFAHRGKRVAQELALGTARYAEVGDSEPPGRDVLPSRAAALAEISRMRGH